jgi:hypothetical protein
MIDTISVPAAGDREGNEGRRRVGANRAAGHIFEALCRRVQLDDRARLATMFAQQGGHASASQTVERLPADGLQRGPLVLAVGHRAQDADTAVAGLRE